jgi:hypothetical protein
MQPCQRVFSFENPLGQIVADGHEEHVYYARPQEDLNHLKHFILRTDQEVELVRLLLQDGEDVKRGNGDRHCEWKLPKEQVCDMLLRVPDCFIHAFISVEHSDDFCLLVSEEER